MKISKLSDKIITIALLLCTMLVSAQASETDEFSALVKRINALEKRVATLEATRTFTAFMPELAERFHVMHRAGEAGDWAVAGHELAEMERLTRQSVSINAERGNLMRTMLSPSFEELESAIEHGNRKRFSRTLETTVAACNGCHAATGSNFVQVTLDVSDNLSMRHPHKLMTRDAPAGHHHGEQGEQTKHDDDDSGGDHGHAGGTPETHGHDDEKQQ